LCLKPLLALDVVDQQQPASACLLRLLGVTEQLGDGAVVEARDLADALIDLSVANLDRRQAGGGAALDDRDRLHAVAVRLSDQVVWQLPVLACEVEAVTNLSHDPEPLILAELEMLDVAEPWPVVAGLERKVGRLHHPKLARRAGPESPAHVEAATGVA